MCPEVDSASKSDFSWGKGGRCVWLTTYHLCNAETSRKSGALTYPEPLGPPRPVAGHLHFTLMCSEYRGPQIIWRFMYDPYHKINCSGNKEQKLHEVYANVCNVISSIPHVNVT